MRVVEVFATMQGEGSLAGTPAVFVRFAGCNLWSGHDDQRHTGKGGCAEWCDTHFLGGTPYSPEGLVEEVVRVSGGERLVVLTGGEPMLQLRGHDGELLGDLLHAEGFDVAIETNGTIPLDHLGLNHVTVSPKPMRGSTKLGHVVVRKGTDLKVIHPSPLPWLAMTPEDGWDFEHRFLQPLDVGGVAVVAAAVTLQAARRAGWRVSLQTHKLVGLP